MAAPYCPEIEVDLSRFDLELTLETAPDINVEVLQTDLVIEAITVANSGPPGPPGPPGQQGNIGNSGPPGPQGLPGAAATVAVGSTVTGAPGSNATVTNSGTASAAVLDFAIPRGDVGAIGATGPTGPQGSAATVAAGTTTTGAPGTNANVTNVGSPNAAIFNFTIPRGDVGPVGPQGPSGSGTGDMLKSIYDTNNNGVVDSAESVPWSGVTGKPTTFPPDNTAMLKSVYDVNGDGISDHAALADTATNANAVPWTGVTGKPTTFPPDSTAMLKSVYDTNADNIVDHAALADTAPWTGITGKPATFPATAHGSTHAGSGTDPVPLATPTVAGLVPAKPNAGTNATTAQVVMGDDTRLTNLRTPSAHASTHNLGGSDAIAPDWTQVANKPANFAPTAHQASHVSGADQIPNASASARGLLAQVSGLTTDYVRGDNTCRDLATDVRPVIWSARLRNYNAIGNPTFEINQRSPATTLTANGWPCDRWQMANVCPTLKVSTVQAGDNTTRVLLPGTSFAITSKILQCTLTTQQASLAAGDVLFLPSVVEGPNFREIVSDVSSLSLLVLCTSALKFAVYLRESTTGTPAHSLVKLCTIPTANLYTLIQLPNIPNFPTGIFSTLPGVAGYEVGITLACGSTFIAPAVDTWQNGNFVGAPGMDNFGSLPVNAIFQIAFIQHEPGPICTTPIDCPFGQNLDGDMGCLRYYGKSYQYAQAIQDTVGPGPPLSAIVTNPNSYIIGLPSFPKPMAKSPTVTIYDSNNGAANSIFSASRGTHHAVSSVANTEKGLAYVQFTAGTAVLGDFMQFHYTADTGW